jgi:hypothetical protein
MVFIRIDYVWVDDISDVFGGLFAGRKNKFFCRLCGIELKTDKDLDTHIRNNHKNDV